MSPPKKRRRALPKQPGKRREYLDNNFADLHVPGNSKDLKKGHVHRMYLESDKCRAKAMKIIIEHYSCKNIHTEMDALLRRMKKFSDSTCKSVMDRFKATCCEPFVLHMPDESTPLSNLPGSSEMSQAHHDQPMVSISSEQPPNVTVGAQAPVKDDDVDLPGHSGSADSGTFHSPEVPETPSNASGSSIRSSKRMQPTTPRKLRLKKRLEFVTASKCDMKEKYKLQVSDLRSHLNFQQINKIKRLNQIIARKNTQLKKREATQVKNVQEELNKFKKRSRNATRRQKRASRKIKTVVDQTKSKSKSECNDMKKKLQDLKCSVRQLENDILTTEELLQVGSAFQKEGKTYSDEMRMSVYDHVVNNVPTSSIPTLIKKTGKRFGLDISDVPHRNTVELMARELGIVSDLISAEVLMDQENLTIAFDATTQEGVHVNSIHITSNDKCYILAVDQLPGGMAEDYSIHVNDTLDHLSDVYCQFYSTDFSLTRQKIINHISNTLTDRAAVNHATIRQLELNWGKNLNELNCHLHPLDTIASSTRSVLKANEPSNLVKKLFGTECIAHQLILGFNKFRYKDSRGDPKGFVSALESSGLPKGLLPRYRGNRLHVMFHISEKLHHHEDFFMKLLTETSVTCGGLLNALLHDFSSPVAKVEVHILGLLGKLFSGPWMQKFYQSHESDISHVDGIEVVKGVIAMLKEFSQDSSATLTTKTDFFGNVLAEDAMLESLQRPPVDSELFNVMMKACLLKTVEVLERQYARYFTLDVTETLRKETESSRCHNIDAESVMGMFSAAKEHAPNATMCFLSARIKAIKNHVVDYLDDLQREKRRKVVRLATTLARKRSTQRRKRTSQIKTVIAKRMQDKLQKRNTANRKKLEKKIKECSLANLHAEFKDIGEELVNSMTDILNGRVVGHEICHVWYDNESHQRTLYNGKIEELKRGGTYRVAYWGEGETYEADAEDFDMPMYAHAADLICEDLTLS